MKEALRDLAPLFQETEKKIRGFKKETYEQIFNDYMEENHTFFAELNQALSSEEDAGFIGDFAECITEYVKGVMEQTGSKAKKRELQLNLNMFMAIYFMPAILEGKQAKAQTLTEAICERWASEFKGNNIKSADFASIKAGFRTKLCYVTTAVCRSLHKSENCREIELLKNYRDQYLIPREGGEALVARYYDVAPTIVKRIDKTENPVERYQYIWETYLQPCITFIENGENEKCGETYISMVEELQRQYVITEKEKSERHG